MNLLEFGGIGENLDSLTRTSTRDQSINKATDKELEQIQAWLELWTISCKKEIRRRRPKTEIGGRILTVKDIGSKVTYIPLHAEGNASHSDCEGGTISSWTADVVFVNYGTGTNKSTNPRDLVWG